MYRNKIFLLNNYGNPVPGIGGKYEVSNGLGEAERGRHVRQRRLLIV